MNHDYMYAHQPKALILCKLEDKRPIGRFQLALAEGHLSPLVKMVTDGESQEGPSGICVLSDLCILDVMDFLICVFDLG